MKIGDFGHEIQAFQIEHGLAPDGICGWDTWSRWRADNDTSLPWQLVRAFSRIGVVTCYSMDIARQGPHCTDCSGFVCDALGITKAPGGPDEIPWWLNTDGVLRDALGQEHCFDKIALADLKPGDMVCYGHHATGVGHIAFVVDPAGRIVCDCSGSRNGVHVHADDRAHFWTRQDVTVYGLRYIGPSPASVVA